MVKFCPECGIKLEKEYKFCPSCGFALGNIKSANKHDETKSAKSSNSTFKSNPREASFSETAKGLSTGKIIGIFAGITGALLLILFLAGVFETPSVKPPVQTEVNQNNQSPGVDLNSMQQMQELQTQINNNPGNMQLILQLAHLKNDSGMPEQAIALYKQYLEKNPKDADVRVDMGVCYFTLKNYPTAISEMKEALKYKPDHQIAHLNLGIVNFAAGNPAESKEWLKKAVDLNPNTDVGKRAQELLNSH